VPNEQDHLRLAEKNKHVIDFLSQKMDQFSDWVTNVAFYRALHLVEAVFARGNIDGRDHGNRKVILSKTTRYQKIYRHYRPLYAASRIARYLQDIDGRDYHAFSDFMSSEEVEQEILGYHLKQIEQSVEKLLQ